MGYSIEVLIPNPDACKPAEWKKIRPTGGDPYVWETREEAANMRRICYPDQNPAEVRIIEVKP